jgi:hypothetical protein
MTIKNRIRFLKFALIAFNVAAILMILLGLLSGASVTHVLLIYGTQMIMFNALIIFALRRLKREAP